MKEYDQENSTRGFLPGLWKEPTREKPEAEVCINFLANAPLMAIYTYSAVSADPADLTVPWANW